MAGFTVFYAWQADLPPKINRYFIRDAIETAIKRIGQDTSIEDAPRLDHDTKDVPGTPPIAETIFEKIASCGVFLADVSFVAERPGSEEDVKKLLPNPNVMIETGYALGQVGDARTVLVLNETFGPAKELPFDLKHRRWPITYALASSDDKQVLAAVRDGLSRTIETAIRTIMVTTVLKRVDPSLRRRLINVLHDNVVEVQQQPGWHPERVLLIDVAPRGVFLLLRDVGVENVVVSAQEKDALETLVARYREYAGIESRLLNYVIDYVGHHLPTNNYVPFWQVITGYCIQVAAGVDEAKALRTSQLQGINHDGKECRTIWGDLVDDEHFSGLLDLARKGAGACLGALREARDVIPRH